MKIVAEKANMTNKPIIGLILVSLMLFAMASARVEASSVVLIKPDVSPTFTDIMSFKTYTVTIGIPSGKGYLPVSSVRLSLGSVGSSQWGIPLTVTFSASSWAVYNSGPGLLNIKVNPGQVGPGSLQPGQTMTVTFSVTAPSISGTSTWLITSYNNNNFDPQGKYATTTVNVNVTVPITITSNPEGKNFVSVDNVEYETPSTFNWIAGNTHSIKADSPVAGTVGTKYVWANWTDGGNQTHDIIVPNIPTTITATYNTYYWVTYAANVPITLPADEWVLSGQAATGMFPSPVISGGTKYIFMSDDRPLTITATTTITGTYQTDFQVTFQQSGSDAPVIVTYTIGNGQEINGIVPFSVWVENASQIWYSYEPSVCDNIGSLYVLTNTSPASPQTVTGPITITGAYIKSLTLTFASGSNPGTVAITISTTPPENLPSIPGLTGPYYDVQVVGTVSGNTIVCIHYNDTGLTSEQEQNLRLYIGDPVDFNGDGKVDGNDISLMQKAIHDGIYSSTLDINHDGKVDDADLGIVQQYASQGLLISGSSGTQTRLPWMDITMSIDTVNNLIYGITDHFSGFGIH
jgi:hypothetical protein